jgi:hypothetical protein
VLTIQTDHITINRHDRTYVGYIYKLFNYMLTSYRAARGNTSLESAVSLTKQIRLDIQDLGIRLSKAATDEELLRKGSSRAKSEEQTELEVKLIIADMKRLINRIDDAVPLISLAITTSGVSLSTTLPSTVSPSRLLQASTFLTAGDTNYIANPTRATQVGPVFVLSVYMLFAAHAFRPHASEGVRETTWQEVIHKARVKLLRVPLENLYDLPSSSEDSLRNSSTGINSSGDSYFPDDVPSEGKAFEFAYQFLIVEDLDDDRVHEEEEQESFDEVARAGIREVIPIHEISKIFYADTGKILNIGSDGETNSPILLLRRDINATPPRRMVRRHSDSEQDEQYPTETGSPPQFPPVEKEEGSEAQFRHDNIGSVPAQSHVEPDVPRKWKFPPNLDPEWIAFEVYTETPDSDEEDVEPSVTEENSFSAATVSSPPSNPLSSAFSRLNLRGSRTPTSSPQVETPKSTQLARTTPTTSPAQALAPIAPSIPALRSSLSLLELLIRLTALQQFQQSSHLTITDELLNFFLSESSTTGAGADTEYRKRTRRDARRRVGFDPYDESPIKRRGEEYIDHYGEQTQQEWDNDYDYEEEPYVNSGAFDGEWQYGAGPNAGTPKSARNSPGLRSPSVSLPSPPVGRTIPRRSKTSPAADSVRQPVFTSTQSKGRSDALRRESGMRKSPLGRSESDSTLGTSPSSRAAGDDMK